MINHDCELEAKGLRLVAEHVSRVQRQMNSIVVALVTRSAGHDQSKYSAEEIGLVVGKPAFDKYEYMSKEERNALAGVQDALVHHYSQNSHHPEHYQNGVDGMSLLDLIEMCCDWKAAGEMSPNGNFALSLEYNEKRFGLAPQLAQILMNTGREMGWIKKGERTMTPDEQCDCEHCHCDCDETTNTMPSQWFAQLDTRQQNEVRFAQLYADTFDHGTDGHHRLKLIAKMADLLDEQELRMTLAVGDAIGASV